MKNFCGSSNTGLQNQHKACKNLLIFLKSVYFWSMYSNQYIVSNDLPLKYFSSHCSLLNRVFVGCITSAWSLDNDPRRIETCCSPINCKTWKNLHLISNSWCGRSRATSCLLAGNPTTMTYNFCESFQATKLKLVTGFSTLICRWNKNKVWYFLDKVNI